MATLAARPSRRTQKRDLAVMAVEVRCEHAEAALRMPVIAAAARELRGELEANVTAPCPRPHRYMPTMLRQRRSSTAAARFLSAHAFYLGMHLATSGHQSVHSLLCLHRESRDGVLSAANAAFVVCDVASCAYFAMNLTSKTLARSSTATRSTHKRLQP